MRVFGAVVAGLIAGAGAVAAAPVSVAYGGIARGTVEDFERYEVGSAGEPDLVVAGTRGDLIFNPPSGRFDGFSVATGVAHVALVSDEAPCGAADKCLELFTSPVFSPVVGAPPAPLVTTFSGFLAGTKSVGFRLPGSFPALAVEVTGARSGLSVLTLPTEGTLGPAAFGFFDPEGIVSIRFDGPAAFDDVVTSTVAPVPLPGAVGLLLLGLGGLALVRTRAVSARGQIGKCLLS